MLNDYNPDIGIISEANLWPADLGYQIRIPGYQIVTTIDFSKGCCSRLVVLVREGVNVILLQDYMDPDISSIWLKLPRRGMRPLIVGAIYREHKLLD